MNYLYTILLALLFISSTSAQDKWDVTNPELGDSNVHTFTTNEGTWMNLDVSPDGKQIVFDLLGDIYIMPVKGGKAKLLRGGHALKCNHDLALMECRFHLPVTPVAGTISGLWMQMVRMQLK